VRDKRIVLVDDSIVRGTTFKILIKSLREAGAKEVHVRISSPPYLYPCYYGTDVPSFDQLILYSHTVDEVCKIIGADSLAYLDLDQMQHITPDLQGTGCCNACFTGNYPVL